MRARSRWAMSDPAGKLHGRMQLAHRVDEPPTPLSGVMDDGPREVRQEPLGFEQEGLLDV
jgi:hypothetical protein